MLWVKTHNDNDNNNSHLRHVVVDGGEGIIIVEDTIEDMLLIQHQVSSWISFCVFFYRDDMQRNAFFDWKFQWFCQIKSFFFFLKSNYRHILRGISKTLANISLKILHFPTLDWNFMLTYLCKGFYFHFHLARIHTKSVSIRFRFSIFENT